MTSKNFGVLPVLKMGAFSAYMWATSGLAWCQAEDQEIDMTESENKFLSLLFAEGRVLDNLKFFPGPECASAEQLFEAGRVAIETAMADEGGDNVPADGRKVVSIGEYVQSA